MHAKCLRARQGGLREEAGRGGQHLRRPGTKKPLPYAEVGKKLYASKLRPVPHGRRRRRARGRPGRGSTSRNVEFSSPTCRATRFGESDDDAKWDDYLRGVDPRIPRPRSSQGFQNVMPSQESASAIRPAARRLPRSSRIEANKPTSYKEKKLAAIIEYIKSVGNPKYYKPMKTPEAMPPTAGEQPQDCRRGETAAELPAQRQPQCGPDRRKK